MLNKCKKYITILLASLMTVSFVGCKENKSENKPKIETTNNRAVYTGGIHKIDYTETSKKLTQNGQSEYQIVIADDANEYIEFAATELYQFFYEATGAQLPIVKTSQVNYTENSKFIVLGINDIFTQAGLTTEGLGLSWQGYMIKTVGDTIFITGEHKYATANGVYKFLNIEFGFETFSQRYYYLEKKSEVFLKNFNIVDAPDFARVTTIVQPISNNEYGIRMGFYDGRAHDEKLDGTGGSHNTLTYWLPPDTYKNKIDHPDTFHPDWYADDGKQLCYLAHGNAEELQKMKETVVEKMKACIIEKHGEKNEMFSFSMEDTDTWCSCSACTALYEKHNHSWAGSMIMFLNSLSEMLENWMNSEEGAMYKKDVYITSLAYNKSVNPPVYKTINEKTKESEYTPVSEEVVCRDNVYIQLADVYADIQLPLDHPINEESYDKFKGWNAITEGILIYFYDSNDVDQLTPYNVFEHMEYFYQYAKCAGAYTFHTDAGNNDTGGRAGWQTLKTYLSGKLAWNVNGGINNYIDTFFKYNYGAAGTTMKTWFDEYRVHSVWMAENVSGQKHSLVKSNVKKESWPRALLQRWVGYSEQALKEIEYLKTTDLELYQIFYDNITLERVSLYFLLVELYESELETDYVVKIKNEFKADCDRIGVMRFSGSRKEPITDIYKKWGI